MTFESVPFTKKSLDPQNFKAEKNSDPLAISGIDCIEIFAANAKITSYYLSHAFGFSPIGYRGPETGYRDGVGYVLAQGDIRLVITGALKPSNEVATEAHAHGLTVRDVALLVPNCEAFYYEALRRGAESIEAPTSWTGDFGEVRRAAIRTYGDLRHSIAERVNFDGFFWPGYIDYKLIAPHAKAIPPMGLEVVDHVVGNVELGEMETWVEFYKKVLGFDEMTHFTDDDISTEYSALMSKVMSDGSGKIKFPINEPADGERKSQIEEYLEFHRGPGVQHLALRTNDIIKTVSSLRASGVQFLRVPSTYYDEVPDRVGKIKEDLKELAKLGILIDRDDDGYLLQIFTKPLHDRPTLFFEIIQREGSRGFGAGNFKALFEAIEREQDLRGNL